MWLKAGGGLQTGPRQRGVAPASKPGVPCMRRVQTAPGQSGISNPRLKLPIKLQFLDILPHEASLVQGITAKALEFTLSS